MDADLEAERGRCYKRDLGHLSDSQWLYACEQARKREWFPSIGDLLELAEHAPVDTLQAQARLLARVNSEPEQFSRVTPPLRLYEALVQEHPRLEGEGPWAYMVRIAEMAGVPKGGKGGAWELDPQRVAEAVATAGKKR